MKVVLFCGGFGMRLREYSESIPKPMVPIGYRPILWHVMKYYAHFGHKDFVLCLGWQANVIKNYFLNYDECVSNNFVLSGGGKQVSLLSSDIDDWKITFVDTGNGACIGERLKAVEPFVKDEEVFLANYTDGLSNVYLPDLIDFHRNHDSVATFVAVKPTQSFHAVSVGEDGLVNQIEAIANTDTWMNGGYFVFTPEVFQYMEPGEDLVGAPFTRLSKQGKLSAYKHRGFWSCMDTYKEKQTLDEMYDCGNTPWALWTNSPAA
ncbi:MAG: glucose-1-phosphate cytidylyltransferase [Planctomycetales bacterium]|nr:glucose-1-phosphate cytidylyltransferase [Planctomycetales bacterium]MCA9170881.1 glucose-1-phosphate cytidylyltransferase [Planctomycetales bacterium]